MSQKSLKSNKRILNLIRFRRTKLKKITEIQKIPVRFEMPLQLSERCCSVVKDFSNISQLISQGTLMVESVSFEGIKGYKSK